MALPGLHVGTLYNAISYFGENKVDFKERYIYELFLSLNGLDNLVVLPVMI